MLDAYGKMIISFFNFANSEFGNGLITGILTTCVVIVCILMIWESIAEHQRNKKKKEKQMKEVSTDVREEEKSHADGHCT